MSSRVCVEGSCKRLAAARPRCMARPAARSRIGRASGHRSRGEVSEMALAHTIDDKVEAAYRRGELMKKRAAMMQQWARFVLAPAGANVVPIGRRGSSHEAA